MFLPLSGTLHAVSTLQSAQAHCAVAEAARLDGHGSCAEGLYHCCHAGSWQVLSHIVVLRWLACKPACCHGFITCTSSVLHDDCFCCCF